MIVNFLYTFYYLVLKEGVHGRGFAVKQHQLLGVLLYHEAFLEFVSVHGCRSSLHKCRKEFICAYNPYAFPKLIETRLPGDLE